MTKKRTRWLLAGAATAVAGGLYLIAQADVTPQGNEFRVDPGGERGIGSQRSVLRNPDGSFVVVWQRLTYPFNGNYVGIFGQRFSSDTAKIGDPFRISPQTIGAISFPSVARSSSGNFVVVWSGTDNSSYGSGYEDIFGQRVSSTGSLLGDTFLVNTYTTGSQGGPSAAYTGSGNFVVVWRTNKSSQTPDYDYEIFGQRFSGSAAKVGSEFHVNSYTTNRQDKPRVASADNGSFVVVWESGGDYAYGGSYAGPDGAYAGVAARRFSAQGAPLGPEFVVNTFTTYSEDNPDLAVHSDGSFVVVWHTQYGDGGYVPGQGYVMSDSITMRRYNPSGAPIGDEQHINSFTSGTQTAPAIAMNDDGSFVVVWNSGYAYLSNDIRDPDGGVFGRGFTANGTPDPDEFQVNSYTTYAQTTPSIASDGNGNFVVVWEGADGATDNYGFTQSFGIAGRMFTQNGGSGGPGLSITKSDADQRWGNDATIRYQLRVTNGTSAATTAEITEIVPLKTTFSSVASTSGWACTPDNSANSVCTLDLGTIGAGGVVNATFSVTVDAGTDPLWSVFNSAAVRVPGGQVADIAEDMTQYGICDALNFDESQCDVLCYFFPVACDATTNTLKRFLWRLAVQAGVDEFAAGRIRDRVLSNTRGGQRLLDLYYGQSANAVAAAIADPTITTLAQTGLVIIMPTLTDLGNGNAGSVTLDSATVNALLVFFTTLRNAANAELAGVLDRELARLDIGSWVGLTLDELLARLDRLTCEGFEASLFCGEITGDCRITATDALAVLRIAVGSDPSVAEADVDGSGRVTASDALRALKIAIGLLPPSTDCNP